MAGYYEELYGVCLSQAFPIVSGMLSGFDSSTLHEVTHDVTVDFLFHSSSFRDVYDANRDMEPFFRAYVRLRTRRYRDRLLKGHFHGVLRDDSAVSEDMNILMFETQNHVKALAMCLSDKLYYSRYKPVRLYDLFVLSIMSFEEFGKTNVAWIANKLNCPRDLVKDGLLRMRALLKENMHYEPPHSGVVYEG